MSPATRWTAVTSRRMGAYSSPMAAASSTTPTAARCSRSSSSRALHAGNDNNGGLRAQPGLTGSAPHYGRRPLLRGWPAFCFLRTFVFCLFSACIVANSLNVPRSTPHELCSSRTETSLKYESSYPFDSLSSDSVFFDTLCPL